MQLSHLGVNIQKNLIYHMCLCILFGQNFYYVQHIYNRSILLVEFFNDYLDYLVEVLFMSLFLQNLRLNLYFIDRYFSEIVQDLLCDLIDENLIYKFRILGAFITRFDIMLVCDLDLYSTLSAINTWGNIAIGRILGALIRNLLRNLSDFAEFFIRQQVHSALWR